MSEELANFKNKEVKQLHDFARERLGNFYNHPSGNPELQEKILREVCDNLDILNKL